MWYELDEGSKLIKKQYEGLMKEYIVTDTIGDKELLNIDTIWEMLERVCYKLEEVQSYIRDLPDY